MKGDHTLKCQTNYEGSALAMELGGATRIFKRAKDKLRYTEFYGDGDSKSFAAVKVRIDTITNVQVTCRNGLVLPFVEQKSFCIILQASPWSASPRTPSPTKMGVYTSYVILRDLNTEQL